MGQAEVPGPRLQPERALIPLRWLYAPDIPLYNLSKLRSLFYSAKAPPNRKTKISDTSGTTCHWASASVLS